MRQLRKVKREEGQALTEFALVMPLLFVLIFAIVESALTLNSYLQLTDAVRVSARVASVDGSQGSGLAAADAARALSDAAGNLSLQNVQVTAARWESGQPVTVQASVPYRITLPLFGTVMSGYLTSRSIQRIE